MNNDLFFEFLNEVWQERESSISCRYYTLDPAAAPTMK